MLNVLSVVQEESAAVSWKNRGAGVPISLSLKLLIVKVNDSTISACLSC